MSQSDLPSDPGSGKRKSQRPRTRCAICRADARAPIVFGDIRPSIAELMAADHPALGHDDVICRHHLTDYRTRHVENILARERGELSELERQVVASLAREETVSQDIEEDWEGKRSFGERAADIIAEFGGSWRFILSFIAVLIVWMIFNVLAAFGAFDPYPFILLNLVLSCLAALQAPIIMMSQKRQEHKDRLRSQNDFRVNLKAELEIRHLHEKIDHLLTRQWERLVEIQQVQLEIMHDLSRRSR
jgi:uncharacterized membrane protein